MNCSSEDPTCEVFLSTNLTEQESLSVKALKISLLSFSLLFGVPTHSYVIWLIVTGSGVASDLFNLNISVCGIFFSLYAMISLLRTFSNLQESATLILMKFLTGNIFTVLPMLQCLICVERYLAVVHPVTFLKFKPLRYRVICSAAVWITGLGSCVFCMFIVATNNIIFMWFSVLQFLLCFFIQLFCLVAVLRALKQSGPGERREKVEENHMKRRAFYLILTSIMTLLIIFVPFISIGFLCILLQKDSSLFILFSSYCFVLGSFLPAFHYLRRTGNLPFFKPP